MSHITKKQMLESYPEVTRQNDLLGLYLYDTQMSRKPDATESVRESDGFGTVRVQLYRANGAQGGYVVISNVTARNTRISTLDDACAQMRDRYDNYTLPLRLCLERLTAVRNKHTDTLSHTSAGAL